MRENNQADNQIEKEKEDKDGEESEESEENAENEYKKEEYPLLVIPEQEPQPQPQ
jgi:hypothetical protein